MMGRLKSDQGQLFYEFHLGDAVPEDHLVRKIDTALDLSWRPEQPVARDRTSRMFAPLRTRLPFVADFVAKVD